MFRSWASNTFESLSNPQFRVLWAGTLFSTLAYMMMFVVQSVVAFDLAGTSSAVGLVMLGVGVSMFVVGPFGGVIADRVNRRHLIILGQGFGALMLFLTGVLIVVDLLTLELLVLLTLLLGLSFAFMGPARQAFVGEIVGPKLLPNAVALSQLAHSFGQPFSPMLAGVLLETFVGAGGTYILMGSLVTLGVLSVATIRPSVRRPSRVQRSMPTELKEGLNHVRRNPRVRLLLILFISIVVLGFLFRVLLPAFLERHLDREPTEMGLLLLVNGGAAAVVSLLLAGAVGSRWAWPILFLLTAAMGVGYVLLSQAQTFNAALLTMLLLGPGLQGPILIAQSQIMMHTEPAYYGRVMSLTMMAWGLQAVIGFPIGALADSIGERDVLLLLGLATFVVTALGLGAWLAMRRRFEEGGAMEMRGLGRHLEGGVMIGQKTR